MPLKINPAGMKALEARLSAGLNEIGDAVYDAAYALAPVELERDPAFTRDELHVVRHYSESWPHPVVYVSTGSGDGFWVHEGTSDTPAHPFLTQAVDSVRWRFGGLMEKGAKGASGITSSFGAHWHRKD